MHDKIELLVEETGASPQEAELAMGLANFDVEEAMKILHGRMKDVFVIKAKFLCRHPEMYGLMLFIANVAAYSSNSSFRLRFVFSGNPHLYETDLNLHWYEFEKEIYRARLSEWCHMGTSQTIEKDWETKISDEPRRLALLKESIVTDGQETLNIWLQELVASSHYWRIPPKFNYKAEVLSVREFQQTPAADIEKASPAGISPPSEFQKTKTAATAPVSDRTWAGPPAGKTGAGHNSVAEAQRSGEEIFLNLRIALETAPNLPHAEPGLSHPIQLRVGDLKPGDIVQTYVLETRDAGMYLAEVFGGYSNYGLLPIAVPIESVWREGDLIKVRVRFGYAVTGEGVFPPELRVYAARKKSPKASLFRRILSWP